MSKYSERVQEILKNANSKKVTDKKKCVVELLELYDNEAAVKEICENTKQNVQGVANWSYIIHTVHKLLVNEADRLAVKDNPNRPERQNTCAVILKTIQNANSNKIPLIKCLDILPMILQILETRGYEYYHDTYMHVLVTYVLPIRAYQVNMSSDQWKELLKICISLYKNGTQHIFKRTVLDALQMIVDYGCLYSDLRLDAKKMLPFLENVFRDAKANQEVLLEAACKLANTVCQWIGTECRIALCRFSEKILPDLISLNSFMEKYKLMLFFVQIHHPKGVTKTCDGAYAHEWEEWHAILKSMYLMILKDCKPDILPTSLIHLGCEVFKQVLGTSDFTSEVKSFDESIHLQPLKRRRILTKMDGPLDMIVDRNIEEAWPIIQMLTVLLERYPQCLKPSDFTPFLKVLSELLAQSCKQEMIMDSLYKLAAILLKNEKSLSTINAQSLNIYWDKIWDILLRSLNMNQNEVSGHSLAQMFIENNKVINSNALLRLYLTNAMKWSTMSLRTLILFCEHIPLPMDISVFNINAYSSMINSHPVRLCLLKWLLNIPWQKVATQISVEEFCSLLIGITLKSRYKRKVTFIEQNKNDMCSCLQTKEALMSSECMAHYHLSMAYKTNLFIEKKAEDVQSPARMNDNILYIQDLLTYLIDNLCNNTTDSNETDDLCVILIKTAVAAKTTSILKQLNVISDNIEEYPLVRTMRSYLNNACSLLTNIDPSRSKYVHLLNVMKALNVLYKMSYDEEIAKIIVCSSSPDMLKNVFSLMNVEDSDISDYRTFNDYYDEYNAFQDRRKRSDKDINKKRCSFCSGGIIRTLATKALALFCFMDVGREKSDIQISLRKNLLQIHMYDLTRTVDFRMAILVMESLMKYNKQELQRNHEDVPVNVLIELYRQCYKDEIAIHYIINVLPYFLEYAIEYDYKPQELTNVISQLHTRLLERKYGLITYIEFIKLLSKIAQFDIFSNKSHLWKQVSSVVENVLLYLSSPLCIVRLEAARCIHELYSSKYIDFTWKEKSFVQIEEIVKNLFFVNRKLEENEKVDERETRIASALLVLTAIICNNGTLQSRALLTVFRLTVDESIDVKTTRKALNTIQHRTNYMSLIEENLSYILSYWLNSEYSMKSFPWVLADCESQEQFQRMYINTLVSIKFQHLNVMDALNLCNYVGLPFERVFENIFPQVISWLVYCIADEAEGSRTQQAKKIFRELLSNRYEFVAVKKFSDLFNSKFEEILIYLIERLHDEEHLEQLLNVCISLPNSNPPHFKKISIDACLKYMEENLFAEEKPLQYILAHNYPNELQRMLLHLIDNVYKKEFIEHKLKAFHQYAYFCTIIIRELKQDYFHTFSMFLVREIGYSLLHIINGNSDILCDVACKYFYTFVKNILPTRSEEMKDILNFSVRSLIPIALTGKIPTALNILEFLIVDQKDILYSAIEKLNSFPNVSIFQEIRKIHNALKYKTETSYGLEKEIQHFLNAILDKSIDCSVEDISYLRLQLSARKEELRELYNKLETLRGFTEDCALSLLHQLIYRLVKLTGSLDQKVSMEAAKCLGELGPADLTTMILHLGKSHVRETSDLKEILSYKVISLLTEFLVQNDIKLRKASANTLSVVLSSPWGQKLLDTNYMNDLKAVLGDPQMTLCLSYIQPFIIGNDSRITDVFINRRNLNNIMNPSNDNWTSKSNGSYTEWIVGITCDIVNCFPGIYFESFIPVCKLSTDFCEVILSRLIFLIIDVDENLAADTYSCMNQFFEYQFSNKNDGNDTFVQGTRKTISCDRRIVHCMLNIVNYIRTQIADTVSLKLNYMYIAKAAQYCSAFFTAILYAEISCENMLSEQDSNGIPKIDYICELDPEQGRIIQNILRDTYLKIGDPDAIYGCGSSHLENHSSRVQHYIHTRKWDKVILAQDVELSFDNHAVIREMANGLHQSGLQYLLGHFVSTISKGGEKINNDVLYESAWRLSDWSLCDSNYTLYAQTDYDLKSETAEMNYHFFHYEALKCFHESNEIGVRSAIDNARISIIKELKNISLESSKTIYEKLMQLSMIREIEELSFTKHEDYEKVLRKWKEQDIMNSNEFQYIEPILIQRTVMYQIKDALVNNPVIKQELVNTYLEIAEVAAEQDHLPIAARALAVLAKQQSLPSKIQDELLYHESVLAWHRKDLEVGRFLLRRLIHKESLVPSLRAKVLRVYGDWMAETKSENPQAVIKKYYLESINTSNSIKKHTPDVIKNLHDTQVALARFADAQFEQISSYMRSPQFENLKECIAYSCNAISIDPGSKDQDLRRAVIISKKQNTNDVAELEHIQRERNNYLILALRYYLMTLRQSEDYNLLIFRVIALWLDNMYHEEVNQLLRKDLDNIPSFKFIPLIPQLAAHMSNTTDEFSIKINKIMERCALEHPHHTLPVLLALKNLYGDYKYKPAKKNAKLKEEARVLGAKKLVGELQRSKVSDTVRQMETLSHSLVMLANLDASDYCTTQNKVAAGSTHKIPKNQEILKIRNFTSTLVPTLTLHVKPSGNYKEVIGISKYAPTFETVGGVNAPKKVICIGTDGISRHQLVKGQDDLRQDAVMQQVFTVMNTLLKACKETKRRKLMIRTYKVVPLTQRSGILEWCENTIPILTVLVGSNTVTGLHKKYYPEDYTPRMCREKLEKVVRASNDVKLKTFMDCCEHMHPALHHFFTEKYPSPEIWFERRLAYIRSVATTSMAGYILGLGDRHLSNILIDQTTGEVIHIDFGIAFEQGKVLPIPETIPFRLTRNIEAAMGVSGVEGTMRRCCEKTLTVLRDQRQIIITLLQVLLYDPLFTWAITPAKAHDIQGGYNRDSGDTNQGFVETNKTAERALLRIEQKLQGTEEGLASSVSGQVERLIQQARDPSNLCRLFCGWQPYL